MGEDSISKLLDKIDEVLRTVAAIPPRIEALEQRTEAIEKRMDNTKRPCEFLLEHEKKQEREAEDNKAFWRKIAASLIASFLVSGGLAIVGGLIYAINSGWLSK